MLRIGQGYDVHRLMPISEFQSKYPKRKAKLILGGIEVEHNKVLEGHSDADVVLHAIMDALLGAATLGDIGLHFPPSDESLADIDSKILLAKTFELIKEKDLDINNIDVTIIAQKPKLRPNIDAMRECISGILNLKLDQINIKATTTEKLGFAGREEGIAAEAVALLSAK